MSYPRGGQRAVRNDLRVPEEETSGRAWLQPGEPPSQNPPASQPFPNVDNMDLQAVETQLRQIEALLHQVDPVTAQHRELQGYQQ